MKKNFTTVSTFGATMLCKAKDTENPEAGEQKSSGQKEEAISEGNVRERIDKGLRLTEEAAKEAAELISKENKQRRTEEMKNLLQRSAYTTDKVLNRLRKTRDIEKADKAFLEAIGALNVEVVAGKHDTTSFEKLYKDAYTIREKAYREADKIYDEYSKKLRQLYVNCWSYNWDYNI